jgi:hypothetical protein
MGEGVPLQLQSLRTFPQSNKRIVAVTLGYLSTPLSPCPLPLCQGAARLENFASVAIIRCTKCGLMLQCVHGAHAGSGIKTIVTSWNRRANVPAPKLSANEHDDPAMLHQRIRDLEEALTQAAAEVERLVGPKIN